jgi:hypothetical protein
LNTNPINWTQFSEAATFNAGPGITITTVNTANNGNTISANLLANGGLADSSVGSVIDTTGGIFLNFAGASNINGSLGVNNGGTGSTSSAYTTDGVIYYNGTALVSTGAGNHQQLQVVANGSAPIWSQTSYLTDIYGTGSNFAELLKFVDNNPTAATSNYVEIANAASGAAPVISAVGGANANISLNLQANGSGVVNVLATGTANSGTATNAEINFYNSSGTNYVGLAAPTGVSSNVVFTLPTNAGTSGYVLTTNGSSPNATLSWSNPLTVGRNVMSLVSTQVSVNTTQATAVAYFNWNYAEMQNINAQLFYEVSNISGGKTVTLAVYNETLATPAAIYTDVVRSVNGYYNTQDFAQTPYGFANTTVASASNGQVLVPQTTNTGSSQSAAASNFTLTVGSTAGFPAGSVGIPGTYTCYNTVGTLLTVTYTGSTSGTFTGCNASPASGTIATSAVVTSALNVSTNTTTTSVASGTTTVTVTSTTGFPTTGQATVLTSTGVQTFSYTGVGATSFTGVTGFTTATIVSGQIVTNSSLAVASTTANTITAPTTFSVTGVSAANPASISVATSTIPAVVAYTGTATVNSVNLFTGISGGIGGTLATSGYVGQNTRISVRVNKNGSGGTNPAIYGISMILNPVL